MQYASISPNENLLDFVYPSVCKFKGQRYATVSTKYLVDVTKPVKQPRNEKAVKSGYKVKLKETETVTQSVAPIKRQLTRRSSMANVKSRYSFRSRPSSPATEEESDEELTKDTEEDDEELKYPSPDEQVAQPLFLKEIGILGEVHQCAGAPSEALKYAHFHGHVVGAMANQQISNIHAQQVPKRNAALPSVHDASATPRNATPKQRICVLPMYHWIEISDSVLSHYDRERLTEANVDVDTNPSNIPGNVNRHFDENGNLVYASGSPTKNPVGKLASSTAQAVSQLTEAFSEAGLPMCFGKANVGVTGKGFKEANVGAGYVIKNGLNNGKPRGDGNEDADNIMITDDISVKILNDEVERKKLYEEITAGVSAQVNQNDQGYVNNLNSAMHLLSLSQPHVIPIASAIAAQNNAIASANAHPDNTSNASTAGSSAPIESAVHQKHHAKTDRPVGEGFQKPAFHKQISFSGFTDNFMMVKGAGEEKPNGASSALTLKPIEENQELSSHPLTSSTEDVNKAINNPVADANSVDTTAPTATPTVPQFEVSAGISTLPQVSLYQVKGAMLKQRNHEVQEAAVAAIKESASKIEDRMEALHKVTESRRKLIALHDTICDSEKDISLKIHQLKHGKSSKNVSGRYHSPKQSVVTSRRHSLESEVTTNSLNIMNKNGSSGASNMMNIVTPTINTQSGMIDFKSCTAADMSDYSSSEEEDTVQPMQMKKSSIPPHKFMRRQSSSAMIIDAMSNMGSATIADTASVSEEGNNSYNFKQSTRARKQLEKSKKRVIGQRMDLLENLMKLPASKTVENELRTKRYAQTRKAKEKELSKSVENLMHKSHSTSAIKEKPHASSLSTKLDVLETMLNKRNGITLMHPSVVEDLAFVENVIPLTKNQLGLEEAEILCNTGE